MNIRFPSQSFALKDKKYIGNEYMKYNKMGESNKFAISIF